MRFVSAVAVALLALCFSAPVIADPFDDGVAAYERGEYATALRLFQPLANEGNARAQFGLGVMYNNGRGVAQDYVRAHMWFNLSASRGDTEAAENRSIVENEMTLEQIAEAQKLARQWKPTAARKGMPTDRQTRKPAQ
jgi:TPR repeat protein